MNNFATDFVLYVLVKLARYLKERIFTFADIIFWPGEINRDGVKRSLSDPWNKLVVVEDIECHIP